MTSHPVPVTVTDEIGRLVTRWRTLTLDQAAVSLPRVHESIQALAALVVEDRVPDVGPGAAMDQLTVVAHDAVVAGHADQVLAELVSLRRDL